MNLFSKNGKKFWTYLLYGFAASILIMMIGALFGFETIINPLSSGEWHFLGISVSGV